ncbi:MAG TPA: sigma-70 family RNA polymerase sigma factor [Ruminiclostridium sp.]|jgi:RNA polymerase sporulation-specific sigma factor|nr:sigma-70 family RNA polymerase sigma factor [Ruminiclostridium sp.]
MQKSALNSEKDENLVLIAQNGSKTALSLIFERYSAYIRYFSMLFKYCDVDNDDLVQEGSIGLVSAVKCFRSDAGASFKTYACLCIKRQILSAARNARREKTLSFSEVEEIPKSVANPEDVVIMRESISSVKNALIYGFSPFERKLFTLYIEGFSYKSIAKELQICTKKVDNSLQYIKRRLGVMIH